MTTEWTQVQMEKATANKIRKLSIDTGEDVRDLATRAAQKGLPLLRDEIQASRGNNTITQ